ncbi:Serine/threonine-protein kinase [Elasticomyces elasticus]|nr:Serine/threonine-protein kinase [Elasticomyces elasticus]
MGQGYSLTTLATGPAGTDVPELGDLVYEKSLGGARFMKTIRQRHKDGLVVTKVMTKPYVSMKLDPYVKAIRNEREQLASIPNALPYHRIIETSTNGYLARQFIHSSLYDRISTRPFLEDIEKKWLAFQLLCAVRDCHAKNIYHGDIKMGNTLVTSWNWLYLTDFSSSYKPTYLPEDNPADFTFYFDTSAQRTCYVAPERFLAAGQQAEGKDKINWAMDIFSTGCVIAELFLEAPTFNLSQLFKYRKGDYSPQHAFLDRIEDKDIREMVAHMTSLDPESRFSAAEYLEFWRGKAFPEYFYSFLHQYMHLITDPTSGRKPVRAGDTNSGESDDRIERVYYDFDKIAFFLGYEDARAPGLSRPSPRDRNLIPLHLDVPNNRHEIASSRSRTVDDGTLMFLNLILSTSRSTARASSTIQACELLLAFAERVTDEAKLDRILPHAITLLNNPAEIVRIAAIRMLTQLVALVRVISPFNAHIFPQYILPRLESFLRSPEFRKSPLVRATYASCLDNLAWAASRFLDMTQALRVDGSLPSTDPEAEEDGAVHVVYQNLYDVARQELLQHFESQTKIFLSDQDPAVRRSFLGSVSKLCVFFGSAQASDVILSHLNTYLNDTEWILKCAFFRTIVGVATYLGGTSLEEFILPLMVQALTDPEEFVVDRVLRSLAAMAELGLIQREKTWELVDVTGRFTMHPNVWVREAAVQFVSASTTFLSGADSQSIISPLVRPYLKTAPSDYSELKLLDALKKPLPRIVLEKATAWAIRDEKGLFWKPAQKSQTFSFRSAGEMLLTTSAHNLDSRALSRVPRNAEDEQCLGQLRAAGMRPEDEVKFLALREYIWRTAHRGKREAGQSGPPRWNQMIPLSSLEIVPQTVFFDESGASHTHRNAAVGAEAQALYTQDARSDNPTIADAILDASTSVADGAMEMAQSRHGNSASNYKPHSPMQPSPLSTSPHSMDRAKTADGMHQKPLQAQNLQTRGSDSTDVLSTSPKSDMSFRAGTHIHAVRHRGSAINLMNKAEASNKATAETGTDTINALGKLDVPPSFVRPATPSQPQKDYSIRARDGHPLHNYTGHDPTVLKYLDSVSALRNRPEHMKFGPSVQPLTRKPIKRSNGHQDSGHWRPVGQLVAVLGEHTGRINRVVVAPDHTFFLTGSDDGSVKVWEAARIERNITHRSRQTHKHAHGVKVSSLCFIENTHTFVSTGSDGSIHVVKVSVDESGRFGKLRLLREWCIPDAGYQKEFAVWTEHFASDRQSVLVLATNRCRVLAIDLRTMEVLYEFQNPDRHGIPTCFCLDRQHQWLLLGTIHGVLSLWDLRFLLRLRSWSFRASAPITALHLHPSLKNGHTKRVAVAGGTSKSDVSVWDFDKVACKEVYRVSTSDGGPERPNLRDYELVNIDVERQELATMRMADTAELNPSPGETGGLLDGATRAMLIGMHVFEDGQAPKHSFIISAGPDRKLRFWDSDYTEGCHIIGGGQKGTKRQSYVPSSLGTDTKIITEFPVHTDIAEPEALSNTAEVKKEAAEGPSNVPNKQSKGPQQNQKSSTSRYDTIRLSAENLLQGNLDTVLDVALLEHPFGMVLAADAKGCVYVFQ